MVLPCPNCGHEMVWHRSDRQQAGQRQVLLTWLICPHCQHIALGSWSFQDATNIGDSQTRDRGRPRRARLAAVILLPLAGLIVLVLALVGWHERMSARPPAPPR